MRRRQSNRPARSRTQEGAVERGAAAMVCDDPLLDSEPHPEMKLDVGRTGRLVRVPEAACLESR